MPRDVTAPIETWIFDLDQTVYHPSARLFDQINARITGYIMRELGLGRGAADALRGRLWRDHGTSLAGLKTLLAVDETAFLAEIHDIDLRALRPDPTLAAAIAALPGRRIVHTNGAHAHARRVLAARGLDGLFDAVYGIDDKGFQSKPHAAAFQAVQARDGFDPTRAAMIEDEPRNLVVPKAMGMVTIWLCHTPGLRAGPHVDYRITDLARFLSRTPLAAKPLTDNEIAATLAPPAARR